MDMLRRVSAARCNPFDLMPGATHSVLLRDSSAVPLPTGSRVSFARGKTVAFGATCGEDGRLTVDVPADSVQGVYKAIVIRPDRSKSTFPAALRVIDPARHQGVVVPEYERWHYLVDVDGIPMKDMGGTTGYVRHPLVATYYAFHFIQGTPEEMDASERDRRLARIMDWLMAECEAGPAGSLVLRHRFDLPGYGMEAGWISGLTQGRVAELCARMFVRTGDPAWRERAVALCRVMFVPVAAGGLLAQDRFGDACIEEYPIEPPNWALNGIGSALASLRAVHATVPVEGADELIDRVADSLDRKMSLFDCPDAPGSRVQLTLPYSVTVLPSAGIGGLRIDGIDMRGPDGAWRTLVLEDAFADSRERGECRMDLGGVAIGPAGASFSMTLDGNRDPRVAGAEAPHECRIRWSTGVRGPVRLTLAAGRRTVPLVALDADPAMPEASFAFDANAIVPGGVGRVARWDEAYHETNLVWMSEISGGGVRPRSRHAMRRWALSRCTGVGRVPVRCDGQLGEAVARAIDEREGDSASQRRLERELLGEALRNAGPGGVARVESVSPREFNGGAPPEVTVLGIGFVGAESAEWRSQEDGSSGRAACETVSGDELRIALPPQARGRVHITVRNASGVLCDEDLLAGDVQWDPPPRRRATPTGIAGAYLSLLRRRDFIRFMVERDTAGALFKTVMGRAWLLLEPLAHMAIYYFLVVVVFDRTEQGGISPFVLIMVGLSHYLFLQRSLAGSCRSILGRERLMLQVPIEPMVFVSVTYFRHLRNLGISLALVAAIYAWKGPVPGAHLAWYPACLAALLAVAWAWSVVLGVLTVFFRDLQNLTGICLRLFLYLSPVIYPLSFVPEEAWGLPLRDLYLANPVASLFALLQWSLLGGDAPGAWPVLVVVAFLAASLALAHLAYARLTPAITKSF
jgi:ABC-type polysaccharide/polyol phosphate export permease